MPAGYRDVFRNRDYANLWTGQTASVLGDSIYQVAFYWLAYKTASSPIIAGVVILCASAPYLFFGLVGGVYADRLNRRRVMIVGDIIRAVTVSIVPILSLLSLLSLPVVGAVAFVLASVRCFFYPASKSAVADILQDDDQRQMGSSVLQASIHAAVVAGAALGGILIDLFSAPLVYFTPVVTYVISILFLLPIKTIPEPATGVETPGLIAEIVDTIKYIRPMRELFWSIVLFGFGLLAISGIDRVALPALSDKVWEVGSKGLGFMLGGFALGNIIGSLVIGKLKITRFAVVIFTGWALWGLFYALIGVSSTFALALVFAFMAGVAEAMNDVPMVILIQTSVPRERMGKVFSMWSTIAFVGESGSALVSGFVVGAFGAGPAYCVAGAGLILIGILGLILTWRPAPVAAAQPAS